MKIYVLLTYTGTMLSNIIKMMTNVPYPHVSIGLDEQLNNVYSFGRLHPSNPIFAGFVREYIDDGLYKRKEDTLCKVLSIEVSEEQYKGIQDEIQFFVENKKKFKYDTRALLRFVYNEPKENVDRYVCSQFVAHVLETNGVVLFDKSSNLVTPLDFYNSNKMVLEYEGLLCEFRNSLNIMK